MIRPADRWRQQHTFDATGGSALVLPPGFLRPRLQRLKRRPVAVVIFGGLKTRILSNIARR